ncbi:hypothetical protein ES707_06718 [subsurface metagenome]
MKIISINKGDHTLTGIVYCANGQEDSQGDFIAKEDCHILYEAMEAFNKRWEAGERALFNLNHNDEQILKGAELMDSYITDKEETRKTEDGEVNIPECSWVIKLGLSKEAFDLVSGATGLSMQGRGEGMEA